MLLLIKKSLAMFPCLLFVLHSCKIKDNQELNVSKNQSKALSGNLEEETLNLPLEGYSWNNTKNAFEITSQDLLNTKTNHQLLKTLDFPDDFAGFMSDDFKIFALKTGLIVGEILPNAMVVDLYEKKPFSEGCYGFFLDELMNLLGFYPLSEDKSIDDYLKDYKGVLVLDTAGTICVNQQGVLKSVAVKSKITNEHAYDFTKNYLLKLFTPVDSSSLRLTDQVQDAEIVGGVVGGAIVVGVIGAIIMRRSPKGLINSPHPSLAHIPALTSHSRLKTQVDPVAKTKPLPTPHSPLPIIDRLNSTPVIAGRGLSEPASKFLEKMDLQTPLSKEEFELLSIDEKKMILELSKDSTFKLMKLGHMYNIIHETNAFTDEGLDKLIVGFKESKDELKDLSIERVAFRDIKTRIESEAIKNPHSNIAFIVNDINSSHRTPVYVDSINKKIFIFDSTATQNGMRLAYLTLADLNGFELVFKKNKRQSDSYSCSIFSLMDIFNIHSKSPSKDIAKTSSLNTIYPARFLLMVQSMDFLTKHDQLVKLRQQYKLENKSVEEFMAEVDSLNLDPPPDITGKNPCRFCFSEDPSKLQKIYEDDAFFNEYFFIEGRTPLEKIKDDGHVKDSPYGGSQNSSANSLYTEYLYRSLQMHIETGASSIAH